MKAKIIGLVQQKGGAGRSTLATSLAGELSKYGRTVLIDADTPQATSASWVATRQEEGLADNLVGDTARDHRELIAKAKQHQDADFVILDGPPRAAEVLRAIAAMSDLALIPLGPSLAEVWATADLLPILEAARKVGQVDARIVWTRYRQHTRLAQDLSEQVRTELGLPILKSTLGFRVAFAEALGSGRTVAELHDAHARDELHALIAEVRRIIK